jgi:cytochrome c oxidase cbb3-type subunit III
MMKSRLIVGFGLLVLFAPGLGLAQTKGDAKAGKTKYDTLCVGCHGATGKGDGSAAAALNPKPGDFTNCKEMGKLSDDTLHKTIKEGGKAVNKSPIMPPWAASLNDQQIGDVVSYVRSFCKK